MKGRLPFHVRYFDAVNYKIRWLLVSFSLFFFFFAFTGYLRKPWAEEIDNRAINPSNLQEVISPYIILLAKRINRSDGI